AVHLEISGMVGRVACFLGLRVVLLVLFSLQIGVFNTSSGQSVDNEITTYRLEIPGGSVYPLENLGNHIHPSPSSLTTEQSIAGFTSTGFALQHQRNSGQFLSACLAGSALVDAAPGHPFSTPYSIFSSAKEKYFPVPEMMTWSNIEIPSSLPASTSLDVM